MCRPCLEGRDFYVWPLESPDRRREALIGRSYSVMSWTMLAAGLTETGQEMGGGNSGTPDDKQTLCCVTNTEIATMNAREGSRQPDGVWLKTD